MAKRNMEVQERVRKAMHENPTLGSRQLFEMAKEFDPSLADAPLAQFHARYVLPVKREQAAQRKGGARPSRARKPRKAAAAPAAPEPKAAAPAPAPRARRAAEPQRATQPATRAAAGGADREQIRAVFLEFAREFAEAESRTQIVQVLSKVDEYVDRVARRTS